MYSNKMSISVSAQDGIAELRKAQTKSNLKKEEISPVISFITKTICHSQPVRQSSHKQISTVDDPVQQIQSYFSRS